MQALAHAKVLQQLRGVALSLPAVHLGELLFQFRGAVAVLLGHLWLGVEHVALLHVVPKGVVAHEYGVYHLVRVVLEVVLLQHGEALARTKFHGALVGLQVAADGAQQGRLAGAVGTDDAIDVATGELDVHVFIKHTFAKLDGKIGKCYHSRNSYCFCLLFLNRGRQ